MNEKAIHGLAAMFCFGVICASHALATTIGIPSPEDMIAEADVIVEGRLAVRGERVELEIDEVVKGPLGDRPTVELISKHSILDFSLSRVALRRGSQRVVVLGRWNARSGTLVMPWLDASIWPREPNSALAVPATLEQARALIGGSARLAKEAEKGPGPLLSELLAGLEATERRPVVLGFLANRIDEVVTDRESRRSLFLIVGSRLARARPMDVDTVRGVARVSSALPASVALDYLLQAAEDATDPDVARLAHARARSVLAGRRLIATDTAREVAELPVLREVATRELPAMRVVDANRALELFDSPLEEFRSRAGEVVSTMLGECPPAARPGDLESERAYWEARVRRAEAESAKP